MKTKREKYIIRIDDGKLIRYFHSHTDRGMDRFLSGLSNLQIASHKADLGKVDDVRDYLDAVRDYLVKALEDVSAARFAGKEIYRRYQRIRWRDRKKADYIREVLKKDVPEQEDVELPVNFFEEVRE